MIQAGRRRVKARLCKHGRIKAGASYIAGDSQAETDAAKAIGFGIKPGLYADLAEATIEACPECRRERDEWETQGGEGLMADEKLPCRCEDCGLRYPAVAGMPITAQPYTCDDCGGYVMDEAETDEWTAQGGEG